MNIQQIINEKIVATFDVTLVELINESHNHSGDNPESHFKLTLVTSDFEGIARVKRHQAVYKALHEVMPRFHALALHTYTEGEWQSLNGKVPDSPKCQGGGKKR